MVRIFFVRWFLYKERFWVKMFLYKERFCMVLFLWKERLHLIYIIPQSFFSKNFFQKNLIKNLILTKSIRKFENAKIVIGLCATHTHSRE